MSDYAFIASGREFTPVPRDASISRGLPVGCFAIKHAMGRPNYLIQLEDLQAPARIYGDSTRDAERIYEYFTRSRVNVGVLLAGVAGSGKTMMSKMLSTYARKDGISTILVNDAEAGQNFGELLQQIPPSVIILDEFEKNYDKDDQKKILTTLDGVLSGRHMFVFTVNSIYALDEHLLNRPGRIRYRIEYHGLTENEIRSYCDDVLINKGHIDDVLGLAGMFRSFNFDMLRCLVEEMNMYGETAVQAVRILNINPSGSEREYEATIHFNGLLLESEFYYLSNFNSKFNPMHPENAEIEPSLNTFYPIQIKNGSITRPTEPRRPAEIDDEDGEDDVPVKKTKSEYFGTYMAKNMSVAVGADEDFLGEIIKHPRTVNHLDGIYEFCDPKYPEFVLRFNRAERKPPFSYYAS